MNRADVAAWLDAYSHAWETYDPDEIGALFSADADYFDSPYDAPVHGREAIVARWLNVRRDPPGTYRGRYEPVVVEGDQAVANGRSQYFLPDGVTLRTEFDNLFLLRFDASGQCSEFHEWYMERPQSKS
ncbi:MAG: YybH family protein [Ktedonobacterales bacterium]